MLYRAETRSIFSLPSWRQLWSNDFVGTLPNTELKHRSALASEMGKDVGGSSMSLRNDVSSF